MSEAIRERFQEVVPYRLLRQTDVDEVFKSCRNAFSIIGYSPVDLDGSIEQAWAYSSAETLSEFIYDVYVVDTNDA